MFWIYLNQKMFQNQWENVVLDVILNPTGKEAAVQSDLDHQVWIVTGNGKDFSWFPVPKMSRQEIVLKSKGVAEFIRGNVHFLLCFKDGEGLRWEGNSYMVNGLGNDFSLHLTQDKGGEMKVFVEHKQHQEGEESNQNKSLISMRI